MVDIISLYFASLFSKTPTTTRRLILSATLGAFAAVGVVFLPESMVLKLLIGGVSLILMGVITPKGVGLRRKIKFTFAFLVFESLVGGCVSLIWNLFDKYLSFAIDGLEGGAVNRKMLFLSLVVLLCIGVFKMMVSFFSNIESEGSVELEVTFLGKCEVVTAFVDSGNLAKDPMDMCPVVLIKKELAKKILPVNIIELSDIDRLDRGVKKRIRLIPMSCGGTTHVLVGIKPDMVRVKNKDKYEELRVTLAIDKEGGTYGGFVALMPSAALDNACFELVR
jgi:sigma-E processing peptidase SpoIIGA